MRFRTCKTLSQNREPRKSARSPAESDATDGSDPRLQVPHDSTLASGIKIRPAIGKPLTEANDRQLPKEYKPRHPIIRSSLVTVVLPGYSVRTLTINHRMVPEGTEFQLQGVDSSVHATVPSNAKVGRNAFDIRGNGTSPFKVGDTIRVICF
jgi:hypothetical protein